MKVELMQEMLIDDDDSETIGSNDTVADDLKPLVINFLDVGQGDSTYIEFPNGENMLVDCGSAKHKEIAGVDAITYLKNALSLKGNKIKYLVITHADKDHYNLIKKLTESINESESKSPLSVDVLLTGGKITSYNEDDGFIKNVIKGYLYKTSLKKRPLSTTYSIAELESKGREAKTAQKSQFSPCADCLIKKTPTPTWTESTPNSNNSVKIYLLSANLLNMNKNNGSIVLMIEYAGHKIILPGDAENEAEGRIIEIYKNCKNFLKSSVMKIGHHGSKNAATEGWLKAVSPQAAFVSADARWEHPYYQTLERVKKHGSLNSKVFPHGYLAGSPDTGSEGNGLENDLEYEDGKINGKRYRFIKESKDAIFCNMYHAKKDSDFFSCYWGGQYQLEIKKDGTLWVSLTGVNPATNPPTGKAEANFIGGFLNQ